LPDTDKKPDPQEGKKKKGKKKHKGRELVECLLVAGALALTIRTFGFQIFKIPTRSMEPALYGNEYHGDRVVAMMWYNRGKLGLKLGEIRRWQVLVFRHVDEELNPTNYIKRVVGLPGEHVEIRDGDIWVASRGKDGEERTTDEPRIARKPRSLQEDLWVKLCDLDFSRPWRLPYYWEVRGAAPLKKDEVLAMVKDGKLLLAPGGRERLTLQWCPERPIDNRFIRPTVSRITCRATDAKGKRCGRDFKGAFDTARPVTFCPKCHAPVWGVFDGRAEGLLERATPANRPRGDYWTEYEDGSGSRVSDVRLSMDFEVLEGKGQLEVVLVGRSERFAFRLPLGEANPIAELTGPRQLAKAKKVALKPGTRHRLEVINVDAEFRAELDGVEIGPCQYAPPYKDEKYDSDAEIVVSGPVRVAVDGLRLYRDIYYGHQGGRMTEVRKKWSWIDLDLKKTEHFFLGDNSLASQDGRSFKPKRERDIVARGLFVAWPLSRMHWIK
jgi:signal peptidase I